MIQISQFEFDNLVEAALSELPARFANLLQNVAIIVEDEPSAGDLQVLAHRGDELLGLFRVMPPLPDQIAIFRGPILRVVRNRAEAVRQVRDTVIHELGHYFGLGDDDMAY